MYKPLTLIIFSAFAGFAHSVAASDLPKPPAWGGQLKERPEWWTNVANQYRVSEDTNFWARIYDAKEKIRNDVGHGLSVIAERRQLIKYATHILETTELRDDLAGELEGEIALTYDYLGEHTWRRAVTTPIRILFPSALPGIAWRSRGPKRAFLVYTPIRVKNFKFPQ